MIKHDDQQIDQAAPTCQSTIPANKISSGPFIKHSCYHPYLNAKQGIKYISKYFINPYNVDDVYSPKGGYNIPITETFIYNCKPKDNRYYKIDDNWSPKDDKTTKKKMVNVFERDYEELTSIFSNVKLKMEEIIEYYELFAKQYQQAISEIGEQLAAQQKPSKEVQNKLNQKIEDFNVKLKQGQSYIWSLTTIQSDPDFNEKVPIQKAYQIIEEEFESLVQTMKTVLEEEKVEYELQEKLPIELREQLEKLVLEWILLQQKFSKNYSHALKFIFSGEEPPADKRYIKPTAALSDDGGDDDDDESYNPDFEDSFIQEESNLSCIVDEEEEESKQISSDQKLRKRLNLQKQQDDYYQGVSKNQTSKYYKYCGNDLEIVDAQHFMNRRTIFTIKNNSKQIKFLDLIESKLTYDNQIVFQALQYFYPLESLILEIDTATLRDQDELKSLFKMIKLSSQKLKTLKFSLIEKLNLPLETLDQQLCTLFSSLSNIEVLELQLPQNSISELNLFDHLYKLQKLKVLSLDFKGKQFFYNESIDKIINSLKNTIKEIYLNFNINLNTGQNKQIELYEFSQQLSECKKLEKFSLSSQFSRDTFMRELRYNLYPLENPSPSNLLQLTLSLKNYSFDWQIWSEEDIFSDSELFNLFDILPQVFPILEYLFITAGFRTFFSTNDIREFHGHCESQYPPNNMAENWKNFKNLKQLILEECLQETLFESAEAGSLTHTIFFQNLSEIPALEKLKLDMRFCPTNEQLGEICGYFSKSKSLQFFSFGFWIDYTSNKNYDILARNERVYQGIINKKYYEEKTMEVLKMFFLEDSNLASVNKLQTSNTLKNFLLKVGFFNYREEEYLTSYEVPAYFQGFPLRMIDQGQYSSQEEL